MVKNLPAMQETRVLTPGSGRSPDEGHGNPLQYSSLENTTVRRAWWTTVHASQRVDVTEATEHPQARTQAHGPPGTTLTTQAPLLILRSADKCLSPICCSASFHSSLQSEWIIRASLQSLRETGHQKEFTGRPHFIELWIQCFFFFKQIEGLWQLWIKQVYQHCFSNSICSLCLSVSHFGNFPHYVTIFSLLLYLLWWSVVSNLWCYYHKKIMTC